MQKWEQRQRQRAHFYMVEQAKPTIKRYSKSRQKPTLTLSRSKNINTNINMPFKQVLTIFQLQKYQQLLINYGFPDKIKDKQAIAAIDEMIKQVEVDDQDRFFSLMSALLSISTDLKGSNTKRTPIMRKTKNKNYPPIHNSTNLKKSESIATKKTQKTPNFRIKSKSNMHHLSVNDTPVSIVTEKTVKRSHKAHDDSTIIHEFRLKGGSSVNYISKTNSLIHRIEERLRKIKGLQDKAQQDSKEVKLFYNQIKDMYLSYDSATLTSNITNIDIEEIIDCYAIQIQNRISSQPLNPQKVKVKSKKINIQKLLKESLVQSKKNQEPEATITQQFDQIANETVSVGSSSSSQKTQLEESQQFFDLELQSIASDLTCFNYIYEDETFGGCSRKDVKNFIQLIMMAGKMEKQTPIISYVYIMRILHICKKDSINYRNWKNLILITLIQASKIWDDQSLQNHSFAKVIHPYTTLEINRLQRHLLNFLNYKLKVQAKQYCESYFGLRKHISSACKTVHLMNLNLQTIKKLQAGTKKCQKNMKETYKKKLNESF